MNSSIKSSVRMNQLFHVVKNIKTAPMNMPGEIIEITLIYMITFYLAKKEEKLSNFSIFTKIFIFPLVPCISNLCPAKSIFLTIELNYWKSQKEIFIVIVVVSWNENFSILQILIHYQKSEQNWIGKKRKKLFAQLARVKFTGCLEGCTICIQSLPTWH